LSYTVDRQARLSLDVFNLFNAQVDEHRLLLQSQLRVEQAAVEGIHFHPAENRKRPGQRRVDVLEEIASAGRRTRKPALAQDFVERDRSGSRDVERAHLAAMGNCAPRDRRSCGPAGAHPTPSAAENERRRDWSDHLAELLVGVRRERHGPEPLLLHQIQRAERDW